MDSERALWLEYAQFLAAEVGRYEQFLGVHGLRPNPESVERGRQLRAQLGLSDTNELVAPPRPVPTGGQPSMHALAWRSDRR